MREMNFVLELPVDLINKSVDVRSTSRLEGCQTVPIGNRLSDVMVRLGGLRPSPVATLEDWVPLPVNRCNLRVHTDID